MHKRKQEMSMIKNKIHFIRPRSINAIGADAIGDGSKAWAYLNDKQELSLRELKALKRQLISDRVRSIDKIIQILDIDIERMNNRLKD